MGKIRKAVAIMLLVGAVSFNASGAFALNGVVDFQKIKANYSKMQDFFTDVNIKDAEWQKAQADAQMQLKSETSPVARKNLEDKLNAQLVAKYNDLGTALDKQNQTLSDNINKAIEQVAKTKKLDQVSEKAFTYYGGVDITDDVLTILNAK